MQVSYFSNSAFVTTAGRGEKMFVVRGHVIQTESFSIVLTRMPLICNNESVQVWWSVRKGCPSSGLLRMREIMSRRTAVADPARRGAATTAAAVTTPARRGAAAAAATANATSPVDGACLQYFALSLDMNCIFSSSNQTWHNSEPTLPFPTPHRPAARAVCKLVSARERWRRWWQWLRLCRRLGFYGTGGRWRGERERGGRRNQSHTPVCIEAHVSKRLVSFSIMDPIGSYYTDSSPRRRDSSRQLPLARSALHLHGNPRTPGC